MQKPAMSMFVDKEQFKRAMERFEREQRRQKMLEKSRRMLYGTEGVE